MLVFEIKRNDLLPVLNAILYDKEGAVFDLSGGTVQFMMRPAGSSTLKVDSAATVVSATAGSVRYTWASGDTDTAGDYEAEFEYTSSGSKMETFPLTGYILVRVIPDLG